MIDNILKKSYKYNASINLIASENKISDICKEVYNKYYDLNSRYFFNQEAKSDFNFPGVKYLKEVDGYINEKIGNLLETRFVDLNAISGLNLMNIVLSGFTNIGDSIITVSPENGGHPITSKIAKRLGLNVYYIPFEGRSIDYKRLIKMVIEINPKMIYVDQMSGISNVSFKLIKKYIPKEVMVYYDISHNSAFVFSGSHINPLDDGYDAFGGSTHKTIPGPHKAFFTTNNESIFEKYLDSTVVYVSHNHYLDTIAFGFLLEEFDGKWEKYTKKIIDNTKVFAKSLESIGFDLLFGVEKLNNHQVLVVGNSYIDNDELFELFNKTGIFMNYIILPWNNGEKGFRIGLQEFTYLGGGEEELKVLIKIIYNLVKEKNIDNAKSEIKNLKKTLISKYEKYFEIEKSKIFKN